MYDTCFKLSLSHLAASHRSLRRFQQVRQHGSPASCVRCQSAQDDDKNRMLCQAPWQKLLIESFYQNFTGFSFFKRSCNILGMHFNRIIKNPQMVLQDFLGSCLGSYRILHRILKLLAGSWQGFSTRVTPLALDPPCWMPGHLVPDTTSLCRGEYCTCIFSIQHFQSYVTQNKLWYMIQL